MKRRVHVFVEGRVQGVFFRDFTRRQAHKFGVKGWVRNLMDGRVEIMAEGDEENLKLFLDEIRKGPPLSVVENLDIEWMDFKGEYQDFRITF